MTETLTEHELEFCEYDEQIEKRRRAAEDESTNGILRDSAMRQGLYLPYGENYCDTYRMGKLPGHLHTLIELASIEFHRNDIC